jgi:tetratricopeptide (TPR) repeat protein/CHAT domain-containing protein
MFGQANPACGMGKPMKYALVVLIACLLVPMALVQQVPRSSRAGRDAEDELLRAGLAKGGLKNVTDPKTKRPVVTLADAARLRAAVASRRKWLTPALRDTLAADWLKDNRADRRAVLVSLLGAMGETVKDDLALAYAATFRARTAEGQARFTAALRHYQEAAHCFARAKEPLWQAIALNNLGRIQHARGQYAPALKAYRQALALRQKLSPGPHPLLAAILNNLGAVYQRQGRLARALQAHRQALTILRKVTAKPDPDVADTLRHLGAVYTQRREYARALGCYQEALNLQRKCYKKPHPALAVTLANLAGVYHQQADYPRAAAHYRQALAVWRKVSSRPQAAAAAALGNLGFVYFRQGKDAEALACYREALGQLRQLHAQPHPDVARTLTNLGAVHQRRGEYDRALKCYEEALALRGKLHPRPHPALAQSLNHLGTVHTLRGDYARALPFFRRAVAMLPPLRGKPSPDAAPYLNNLGEVFHRLGRPGRALKYYRQALALCQQAHPGPGPDVARCLGSIGTVLAEQGDTARALEAHRRALALWRKLCTGPDPDLARSLTRLGAAHYFRGEYDRAGEYFREALAISELWYVRPHPAVARCRAHLAEVLLCQGKSTTAVQTLDEALAILRTPGGKAVDPARLTASELQPLPLTVAILQRRGRALEQQLGKGASAARLREAARTYDLALALLDRVCRDAAGRSGDQLLIGEGCGELFARRVGLCRRLYGLEKKAADLATAFAVAERAQEYAFREALHRCRASLPALRRSKPRSPRPCTVAEARKCLGPNEVALVFVLGGGASHVVLVEKKPAPRDKTEGLAVARLKGAGAIPGQLAALLDPETLSRPARARALGAKVYQALLGPLAHRLKGKDLLIVPDGPLGHLPFEILVEAAERRGQETRAERDHFLIEKHRIRYAPSITLLYRTRQWVRKRVRQPDQPLWAVADPVYDAKDERVKGGAGLSPVSEQVRRELGLREGGRGGIRFGRLRSSGAEVRAVAALLKAPRRGVFTGPQAAEARVKGASAAGELARARYVHFAVHSTFGLGEGWQPALVLSQAGNDGKEDAGGANDGFLTLAEVARLKLNAELVVLSGCRAGRGRLNDGAGVAALARAFLSAGSRGVVCSLWPGGGRETSRVLVKMYGHLQKGSRPAEALRRAQLALLRAGHAPFFWGNFIAIGE